MVFWNPIIRYTMLGSIKLNIGAMVVLRVGWPESWIDGVPAVIWLLFLAALPLIYAKILHKNAEHLNEFDAVSSFGTLYKGLEASKTIWAYPVVFFMRRSLFVAATVYLF